MIQHLRCRQVKESEIDFEVTIPQMIIAQLNERVLITSVQGHMSGFVYKVKVNGETLIKKEIPGPDTVDEFLYEINALSQLAYSRNVIRFYGVILDDEGEHVKGLLISYAEQGALIDVIYDHGHRLPWPRREKWARQIVEGLSEVHEAGFVQGDFTLSNIVVDEYDNAKIIDINRRGCPVGWEPPEATALIESSQRISMYIGVKSDLYQLGMVLWALAEQEDEPENHGRPLILSRDPEVPDWYKAVVRICLADNPRHRVQALDLLRLFPPRPEFDEKEPPSISVDDGYLVQDYLVDEFSTGNGPIIKTVQAPSEWDHGDSYGHTYVDHAPSTLSSEPYYYPTRGRSPPSPMPSNLDYCEPRWAPQVPWTYPRERSFERRRSSSGFDFAPSAMAPEENGDGSFAQRMRDSRGPEDLKTTERIGFATTMDADDSESVVKRAEDDGATTKKMSQADHAIAKQGQDPNKVAQVTAAPVEHAEEPPDPDGGTTATQHNRGDVSRSNGTDKAADDSLPPIDPFNNDGTDSNTSTTQPTTQNPLFHSPRTTERDAPRPIPAALGPRAAEIQNTTSTSTMLDTRQDPLPPQKGPADDSRIDSAIEMTMAAPSSPSTTTANTNPSASSLLLHLGAGHHHDANASRKDSASTIAEDDL